MSLAVVVNGTGVVGAAPPMMAADPVDAADIVEERLAFGLPADADSIRAAATEGFANAQAEWGVAMTEAEFASVDLQARMAFAQSVAETILPKATELDVYAGAYIDQAAEGLFDGIHDQQGFRLSVRDRRPLQLQYQ